jgi:hypothetical protein
MHVVTAIAIFSDSAANENPAILTAGFPVSVSQSNDSCRRTNPQTPADTLLESPVYYY